MKLLTDLFDRFGKKVTGGRIAIPYSITLTETESAEWDPGYYSRVFFDKTLYEDNITAIYYSSIIGQVGGTVNKSISTRLTDLYGNPIPGSEISAILGPWEFAALKSENLISYFQNPLMTEVVFATQVKAEAVSKASASNCSLIIVIG